MKLSLAVERLYLAMGWNLAFFFLAWVSYDVAMESARYAKKKGSHANLS